MPLTDPIESLRSLGALPVRRSAPLTHEHFEAASLALIKEAALELGLKAGSDDLAAYNTELVHALNTCR